MEMMFVMSGEIAGDVFFGLEGDAGTVGAGVSPQASRNRRMSAALVSEGGEKLSGEGARGVMEFWVSGRVWFSSDAGDFFFFFFFYINIFYFKKSVCPKSTNGLS